MDCAHIHFLHNDSFGVGDAPVVEVRGPLPANRFAVLVLRELESTARTRKASTSEDQEVCNGLAHRRDCGGLSVL